MNTTMTAERALKLDIEDLQIMAQRLRRHSMAMTAESASGHPTTCMSCAEIVSTLFFSAMDWDPTDPSAGSSDVFVLSKGHAAPIYYAALWEAGAIDHDLLTLRNFDSPLEGHPTPNLDWVRVATGSLGQGLSAGCGMALARRQDGGTERFYVLLGDGESAEGAVWEAAQLASHYSLDNLCAIVDVNAQGQSGRTMYGHDLETFVKRFEAFGWNAVAVDGHDVEALKSAFDKARDHRDGPTAIIARTLKGKGVSFVEDKDGFHGKPITKGEQLDRALAEIGDAEISVPRPKVDVQPLDFQIGASFEAWTPAFEKGQKVATRQAYGTALVNLGKACEDVFVIDADTKNSTFAEPFAKEFGERYVEAFIAEQNMVGVALGAATEGKLAFCSSFACFLSRAYDFIRMAGYSRPRALVLCGSHCGVSIGQDGASQMALEDLAMMRAVCGAKVYYPSDAMSTERIVQTVARDGGLAYIRTTRPKTPVLYGAEEEFYAGGSKVLRRSEADKVTIVGAGITLHEALAAADTLAADGIAVRVIDAYCVEPVDAATLCQAAEETGRLVVVEDHSAAGGLGEAVAAAVAGKAPIKHLAVRGTPRSGQPEELMSHFGIDAASIVAAVREA